MIFLCLILFPDELENFRSCLAKQSCRTKTELEKRCVVTSDGVCCMVFAQLPSSACFMNEVRQCWWEFSNKQNSESLRKWENSIADPRSLHRLIERLNVQLTQRRVSRGKSKHAQPEKFSLRKSRKFSFIDSKALIFPFMLIQRGGGKKKKTKRVFGPHFAPGCARWLYRIGGSEGEAAERA